MDVARTNSMHDAFGGKNGYDMRLHIPVQRISSYVYGCCTSCVTVMPTHYERVTKNGYKISGTCRTTIHGKRIWILGR